MNSSVAFYKLNAKDDWRFGGFQDLGPFDFANFRLENPNGDVLLVDLDMLAERRPKSSVWSDEKVVMACVHLEDGRVADVFPDTGVVQVYTEDRKHGYEIRLPAPEDVKKLGDATEFQTGVRRTTIGAREIG